MECSNWSLVGTLRLSSGIIDLSNAVIDRRRSSFGWRWVPRFPGLVLTREIRSHPSHVTSKRTSSQIFKTDEFNECIFESDLAHLYACITIVYTAHCIVIGFKIVPITLFIWHWALLSPTHFWYSKNDKLIFQNRALSISLKEKLVSKDNKTWAITALSVKYLQIFGDYSHSATVSFVLANDQTWIHISTIYQTQSYTNSIIINSTS